MAHQQTINRVIDYLRRHFEVEAQPSMQFTGKIALAATFQAVEIDLREIVDLVLREEGDLVLREEGILPSAIDPFGVGPPLGEVRDLRSARPDQSERSFGVTPEEWARRSDLRATHFAPGAQGGCSWVSPGGGGGNGHNGGATIAIARTRELLRRGLIRPDPPPPEQSASAASSPEGS